MTFTHVITADPGASGAAVVRGTITGFVSLVEKYESVDSVLRVVEHVRSFCGARPVCVIEHVWASKFMGPSNAFSFGGNYRAWGTALRVAGWPVFTITPQKWQKVVVPHITSKEDQRKRDLRDAAIAMFDLPVGDPVLPPKTRITLDNADALLLSEYALRKLVADSPLGNPFI